MQMKEIFNVYNFIQENKYMDVKIQVYMNSSA